MSTEKLPIDSDGYLSRRRGQGGGPLALTSLVQLLTASLSVVIIVLVIQEGARLTERVAVQGRQIDDLLIAVSEYQKKVVDYEKEMAAIRAEREEELTVLRERLHALEAQIQNSVPTTEDQLGPGKTRVGQRTKRQAVNSGACLQGPPGIPGRDGRDGLPGRDCPCGSQDVNECASNNGGCAQTCTNTVVCSCGNGFVLNADGQSCDDVNECESNNGGCAHNCTNTEGSFVCSCSVGYLLNANGLTCDDVNECASNNGGCAQTCTNTVGSFVCSCGIGFVLNADGLSCDDVNECESNNGGCAHNCTNTEGSFVCSCSVGYLLNANGLTCDALQTCKSYKSAGLDHHGDGWYIVRPDPDSGPFSVYCDQTTLGGGWMRFYYKAGPNTCHNYEGVTWTGPIMGKINATDFLVSDDVNTANTELSWLFRGFESTSMRVKDTMQAFANLGNCRTPSGSQWSQGYTDAYVFVTGTLETLGTWTSMYVGCGHSSTAAVGQVTNIRFGGGHSHSGEFVHTSCNGYRVNYQNSITSRWNTDNTRVMWIR
ncbi:UDP-glucuronosyltransferase 2A1 [Branchiostoma belcheri]|nr:UDP-glucuronosyltransferase 2A1 [Branchiostoma belcheri]